MLDKETLEGLTNEQFRQRLLDKYDQDMAVEAAKRRAQWVKTVERKFSDVVLNKIREGK